MSFDLMFFNLKKAPASKLAFIDWYKELILWKENHNYDNPNVATESLNQLFNEIIKTFPPLNGSLADENRDPNNPYLTEYSIGKDLIYMGFSWSLVPEAYEKCIELTRKYDVGFFNPSEGNNEEIFYSKDGELFYLY